MTAASRNENPERTANLNPQDAMTTGLATVHTRRTVLRRSLLGVAGAGIATLATGCGWGDDDAEDGAEPGVPEDDGLEGAEDPGEDPSIDEETGIEDDVVGEPEPEDEGVGAEDEDPNAEEESGN